MDEKKLDLYLNILDYPHQHARVISSLTVGELIEEVIKEFELSEASANRYTMYLHGKSQALEARATLAQLELQDHDTLDFRSIRHTSGLKPLEQVNRAVLLEEISGLVFELRSNPTVLGRSSSDPELNVGLSIDLKYLPDGGFVSRRQAQILQVEDEYYVEPLSKKAPTYLNRQDRVISASEKLSSGDRIFVSAKRIPLCFMKLQTTHTAVPPAFLRIESSPNQKLVGTYTLITRSPFSIGIENCDLCVPDGMLFGTQHASILYNPAINHFFYQQVEGAPVELAHGHYLDLSPDTRLRFFCP